MSTFDFDILSDIVYSIVAFISSFILYFFIEYYFLKFLKLLFESGYFWLLQLLKKVFPGFKEDKKE